MLLSKYIIINTLDKNYPFYTKGSGRRNFNGVTEKHGWVDRISEASVLTLADAKETCEDHPKDLYNLKIMEKEEYIRVHQRKTKLKKIERELSGKKLSFWEKIFGDA